MRIKRVCTVNLYLSGTVFSKPDDSKHNPKNILIHLFSLRVCSQSTLIFFSSLLDFVTWDFHSFPLLFLEITNDFTLVLVKSLSSELVPCFSVLE